LFDLREELFSHDLTHGGCETNVTNDWEEKDKESHFVSSLEVFEEENEDFRKVLGLLGNSHEILLEYPIIIAPNEVSLENFWEILFLYECLIVVLNMSQFDLEPAKCEW